ncbi:MAG: CpXC domain-containing protein [Coriobacteriales bacterium]|nr:CpXC domain-containing protein [Coriobacteriales bacterium]
MSTQESVSAPQPETVESHYIESVVTCPACNRQNALYQWERIEATANPERAAQLANGTLYMHTCEHCGQTFALDYPLLYIDRDRKVLAYYPAGTGDLQTLSTLFEEATHRFGGVDLAKLKAQGFRMVITPERHAFIETVAVWRAGLDIDVIQTLKASLLNELASRNPEHTFADAQFVELAENDQVLCFALFASKDVTSQEDAEGIQNIRIPRSVYNIIAGI